jgi:RNA polymerase sigma-70 factor (ECF subfamily)
MSISTLEASPSSRRRDDFERLVRDTESCLFERACRLERSEPRARDLVQDTYERAFRHFDRFIAGTNSRAWLLRIMSHLFIDGYRRRRREELTDPETLSALPMPGPEPPCPWENIDLGEVRSALLRLAPPFQSVLDLHIAYRCSYAEISAELGIPASTVGTRLNRARKKMRALLVRTTDASGDGPGQRPGAVPGEALGEGEVRGAVPKDVGVSARTVVPTRPGRRAPVPVGATSPSA